MNETDIKRLPRLTAILTQLQEKRLLTPSELARRFSVSKRTIYRDIRALEHAGVPIVREEGKGYKIMEGYRVPPVMFSESEANALITAEQLVLKNRDESFVREYAAAISKIKSVLRDKTKDKANLLSTRIVSAQNLSYSRTSSYLSTLQLALTNFKLVEILYRAFNSEHSTQRSIEPFAMYTCEENWLLVAFCRLRRDFRVFRLDRIEKLTVLSTTFEPHKMTLQAYFEMISEKN